jgi:hypothetical protein
LIALVWLYFKALWRQWKALLMGGSLVAAAFIFQLATARPILEPWGYGLLVATLLATSFLAWKEEYQNAQTTKAGAPRVQITDTYAFGGSEPDRAPPFFAVFARLEKSRQGGCFVPA